VPGCPVCIDIPAFINLIAQGDFIGAAKKIKEANSLPAVCGRVCPQEEQCEKVCILTRKQESVAIGNLERFVADYERESGKIEIPSQPPSKGKKVAVVGSGPAGLTCAGDLVKMGYEVTIFEALHKAGGVLVYGIPEFRLPKKIVEAEIDYMKKLGVKIECNIVVGNTFTLDELFADGFNAVFLGLGAGAPQFLRIPGENLIGVYSANEFLTRLNLMRAYLFPEYDTPIIRGKKVAVIGAGNTAMDAARTALRLEPDEVNIIYRRSRQEMPARQEEIRHGEEEGLKIHLLTNPVKFISDENGRLKEIECIKMELGEPDDSGRRRPVAIPNSEFRIEIDTAVIAVGTNAQPMLTSKTPNLLLNQRGYIIADQNTGETSIKGVFAGGDIVTGAATVIEAMGSGKKAAQAIDKFLSGI
jgi:glutamate synthase (NADPH/NADH) small chain